jgi:uncharacterized integral membrane protein
MISQPVHVCSLPVRKHADRFLLPCCAHTQAFVLVFLLMLVLVLTVADHAVGHLLNRRLPFNIPESGVTMLLGMVLGGLITLLSKC